MHSEIQAVLMLSNKIRKRPIVIDLFVSRFTRDMKPKISRPCNLCIEFLRNVENVEIRKVYYFNQESEIVVENFKYMEFKHASNGHKNLQTHLES